MSYEYAAPLSRPFGDDERASIQRQLAEGTGWKVLASTLERHSLGSVRADLAKNGEYAAIHVDDHQIYVAVHVPSVIHTGELLEHLETAAARLGVKIVFDEL